MNRDRHNQLTTLVRAAGETHLTIHRREENLKKLKEEWAHLPEALKFFRECFKEDREQVRHLERRRLGLPREIEENRKSIRKLKEKVKRMERGSA